MLQISRAELKDAEFITKIKTKAYNKEINAYLGRDGGPPGYNDVESQIHIINTHIAYKITLNDIIIGAFFLVDCYDSHIRFEDFVIDPTYQNKGYGLQTINLIEDKYNHIKKWSLSTPTFSLGNQHLYKKIGYIEISRDDHEIEFIKIKSL